MKAEEPAAAFAIRRYEERLARDPGSLAFAPLADAHRKAGRPGEAIKLCREGLERFPDYATARLILAKALADGGEPETALAEVRVILQGNPADAQAHRLAGELERRAGRLPEALAHLRQAAALDPGEDPALRALHEEAVRTLEFRHLSRRVMASATAGY